MAATQADLLRLREGNAALVDLALADIRRLMTLADTESIEALRDLLPTLIETYGSASAALAADWYDGIREDSSVRGRFAAIPAEIPKTGADELISWALATATNDEAFETLLGGGTQRRIVNFSRATLLGSTGADSSATGWIRVGYGECDWCKKYLDGEVRTVEGYDFDAHDWCKCDVDPVFG